MYYEKHPHNTHTKRSYNPHQYARTHGQYQPRPQHIHQWDIRYVDLGDIVDHREAKKRPCIIISRQEIIDAGNEVLHVIPLTSRERMRYRTRCTFTFPGSQDVSIALLEQMTTVDVANIDPTRIATVPYNIRPYIKTKLLWMLGLDEERSSPWHY